MKDLGLTRRILRINIQMDQTVQILHLSQQGYLQKLVERFRMHESKPLGTCLGHRTKLSVSQALSIEEQRRKMKITLNVNGFGSIMYGMVCNRLDLTHVVMVVSRYMTDFGRTH